MYKIQKKDNYFVVTDTSTGIEEIREPRDQIKWKKDVSNDYTFYYNIPNLTAYSEGVIALGVNFKSFAFSDIVDSTSTAFSSVSELDRFLEQTTGKICCTDSTVSAGSASGVYEGFVITINALDATKIDISAGRAVWVDFWTNPPNPVTYDFSVPAQVGVSVPNLLTSTRSYIGVDYTGTFFQYSSRPDNEQGRDVLILAQIEHADNTTVKSINDYTSFFDSPHETIRDLIWQFNLINDLNTIFPNGNNLHINKTAGELFGMGINRTNNIKNPNKRTTAALTVAPFRYITQTGGTTANVTLIDPTKYDNAGTVTNIPASGTNATNQRVYLYPNNNIIIQYGQTVYSSLALAVQGIQNESFTIFENVAEGAILIGIISVRRDAVHLANTNQAKFIPVSKFGENIGGASGISTSNLQQAYDNSVDPEILTNSTLGAVSFKRGSGADTDNVIEVQNGVGTVTAKISGEGEMSAEKVTVLGSYSLPVADGAAGQVMQTNGAGVASWSTPSSGLTVGTTAISSGAVGRVLFEGAGNVVQESANFTTDGLGALTVGNNTVGFARIATENISGIAVQTFKTSSLNDFPLVKLGASFSSVYADGRIGLYRGNTETIVTQVNSTGGYFTGTSHINIGFGINTASGSRLDVKAQGALSTDIAFRVRNSADATNLVDSSGNGSFFLRANTGDMHFNFDPENNRIHLKRTGIYTITTDNAVTALELSCNVGDAALIGGNNRLNIINGGNFHFEEISGVLATSGAGAIVMKNRTAPSTNVQDRFYLYSADQTAGNAAPHFRTENGSIIKLYQNAAVTTSQGIADVLTNLGLLASSTISKDSSGFTTIVKTENQDVTGSTTLVDDTDLQFSVVAGGHYMVELTLALSGDNTTADYKFAFNVSSGTITGDGTARILNNTNTAAVVGITANAAASTTSNIIGMRANIDAILSVPINIGFYASANATFKFQFANSGAAAGAISRTWKGSILKYKRLD